MHAGAVEDAVAEVADDVLESDDETSETVLLGTSLEVLESVEETISEDVDDDSTLLLGTSLEVLDSVDESMAEDVTEGIVLLGVIDDSTAVLDDFV